LETFFNAYKNKTVITKKGGQLDEQEADAILWVLFMAMLKWALLEDRTYTCCCTQILHYVNQVTNVLVNPIVTSFDQIMGNILGIQISLLLRVYLLINVLWYCGVDQTKQQSNTRFSL
jgi:hypothetical protein